MDNSAQDPLTRSGVVTPPSAHDSHRSESDDDYDSDPGDLNYQPGPAQSVHTTPSQRIGIYESLSTHAKKRVDDIQGNGKRCIVTNAPEFNCVQYAHVLARKTNPHLLGKLEYYWGLKYGTLNLDTRYNVMRLHIYLHYLFDRNNWILLPEEQIVNGLTDITKLKDRNARNARFQAFFKERKTYTYKLVPAEKMRSIPILRYSGVMTEETTATPENFKLFCYPFDELPIITSHIKPHFVICNLGLKVQTLAPDFIVEGSSNEIRARILTALALFILWVRDVPAEDLTSFRSDGPPPKGGDDNDSAVTKQERADREAFKKYNNQLHAAQTSPSARSSQKRRRNELQDGDIWLDDQTLHEFDGNTSPTQQFEQKMESVAAWLSSTSDVQFDIAV